MKTRATAPKSIEINLNIIGIKKGTPKIPRSIGKLLGQIKWLFCREPNFTGSKVRFTIDAALLAKRFVREFRETLGFFVQGLHIKPPSLLEENRKADKIVMHFFRQDGDVILEYSATKDLSKVEKEISGVLICAEGRIELNSAPRKAFKERFGG